MSSAAPHPEWIEILYRPKSGRDHLGLGEVSSAEYMQALSPSINALTYHPRYHSLYTFLVDEFWRRDELPRTRAAFREFFRPREWAFSLAAHFCTQHSDMFGIVGSGTTDPLARSDAVSFSYDPDYIKSDFGGYGLYYGTVIAELGYVYPGGIGLPTPVDIPTERGQELAAGFRKEVEDTSYYRNFFGKAHSDLPADVLTEYRAKSCLCQGKRKDAADRGILLDGFLHGGGDERAHSRRESLRLFLDIARQTEDEKLDELAFRELLFFGASGSGAGYLPSAELAAHHVRWRYFQAREYYVYALNGLWSHLCTWGREAGGDVRPLALSAVWEHLDQVLDFDALAGLLEVTPPALTAGSPFNDLLGWLRELAGAGEGSFDAACSLEAPVQEARLYHLGQSRWKEPCVQVSGMLTMLALAYLRFSAPELQAEEEWRFARFGKPDRLSIGRFVADVRARLADPGLTIGALAHWLYAEYVIRQHQLVAFRKLPDDTFRFRYEEGGLRFFSDSSLATDFGFTDPRFDALGTTAHELGLCGSLYEEGHGLTPDGERLLKEGDVL